MKKLLVLGSWFLVFVGSLTLTATVACAQYNPGAPTNSGAIPGPSSSVYLRRDAQHGGVVAGLYTNLAFTSAGSNAIAAIAAAQAGSGATQWVFVAVSSSSNYLAVSSRTGAVLYVQGCVTNGGSGGGSGAVTNGGATINGAAISNGAALTVSGTVTFGLTTNTAYNGASGAAASNLAAQAYGALSGYLPLSGGTIDGELNVTGASLLRVGDNVVPQNGKIMLYDTGLDTFDVGIEAGGTTTLWVRANAGGIVVEPAGLSASYIIAGSPISAVNGSAITNLSAANLLAGGTLPALNGASLTNLSAFSSFATQGSGNVITNLVSGGSVITQQMGTVTGGGETSPSLVSVPIGWGGFRSLTTNSSVLPVFGFVGGDSLTATSALSMLSFVVSATNTAQEKFAVADLSWPVNSATGITVTFNFQTAANGMALAFYNGISNAVTYSIAAVAGTFTTNLAAAGFLTSAAQGAWVQVACFSTNISTNAANTVANGIGRVFRVSK